MNLTVSDSNELVKQLSALAIAETQNAKTTLKVVERIGRLTEDDYATFIKTVPAETQPFVYQVRSQAKTALFALGGKEAGEIARKAKEELLALEMCGDDEKVRNAFAKPGFVHERHEFLVYAKKIFPKCAKRDTKIDIIEILQKIESGYRERAVEQLALLLSKCELCQEHIHLLNRFLSDGTHNGDLLIETAAYLLKVPVGSWKAVLNTNKEVYAWLASIKTALPFLEALNPPKNCIEIENATGKIKERTLTQEQQQSALVLLKPLDDQWYMIEIAFEITDSQYLTHCKELASIMPQGTSWNVLSAIHRMMKKYPNSQKSLKEKIEEILKECKEKAPLTILHDLEMDIDLQKVPLELD